MGCSKFVKYLSQSSTRLKLHGNTNSCTYYNVEILDSHKEIFIVEIPT